MKGRIASRSGGSWSGAPLLTVLAVADTDLRPWELYQPAHLIEIIGRILLDVASVAAGCDR